MPSKLALPIFLAVFNLVAVEALPVQLPDEPLQKQGNQRAEYLQLAVLAKQGSTPCAVFGLP